MSLTFMQDQELECKYFSNSQGSGYILPKQQIIESKVEKSVVFINDSILNPGEMTTLNGHFCRQLMYLGLLNHNEMVFYIGEGDRNLFEETHYYQSVYWISENRIYEAFCPKSGRDFFYIDGKWK